jgi:hypothetical protein
MSSPQPRPGATPAGRRSWRQLPGPPPRLPRSQRRPDERSRRRQIERVPAGGGWRVLRRPRLLEGE